MDNKRYIIKPYVRGEASAKRAPVKKRMSSGVVLAVSGAVVITAVAAWIYWREQEETYETQPVNSTEPCSNNTYSAANGYYHSSAHTWYPYSYGYHDPARGYFYDGIWSPTQRTGLSPEPSVPRTIARTSSVSRGGFGSSGLFHGVSS